MKKLTIFRTCKHDFVHGTLKRKYAYQLFASTKQLREQSGAANLIISSHIPEAVNSAKIIQLAMNNVRIMEQPRLSRYYAGRGEEFKKEFISQIQSFFPYYEHVILVSHNVIISELTKYGIWNGNSLTIEADSWEHIFDSSSNNVILPPKVSQQSHQDEINASEITKFEMSQLCCLPFLTD